MRRTCVIVLLALVLLSGAAALAAPVGAGDTTTTAPDAPQIIPRPNEGRAPGEPGDRGGALQYVVMGLMAAGVAVGAVLVVRESRRSRRAQGRP